MTSQEELTLRRRVAEEATRAAGEVHRRYYGQSLDRDVHGGNRADYTTVADLAAQDAVKQAIARSFPDEAVIGEEDTEGRTRIGEMLEEGCWLTDPLDGTQEFSHSGVGFSCVVGYIRDGDPLAGAVYFPLLEEMFSAARGLGATLNDTPIQVSSVTQLDRALYVSPPSNASTPDRVQRFGERVTKLLPHIEGLRIMGASSTMVCGVAAGRFDLTSVVSPRLGPASDRPYAGQPWETIAYLVIAREAGAVVGSLDGGPPDLLGYNTYAASRSLFDQYTTLMAE